MIVTFNARGAVAARVLRGVLVGACFRVPWLPEPRVRLAEERVLLARSRSSSGDLLLLVSSRKT